jgi:hypothetical protein
MIQEKLERCLKDNCVLAYNMSDQEISTRLAQYASYYGSPEYINTDNDFKEMDTTHCLTSILVELMLFRSVGMPDYLVEKYLSMRSEWVLMYQNGDGITKLWGTYMQHSGQPNTLNGNTILNMGGVGATTEFGEILYAMFKGDDSHIRSTKSIPKKGLTQILSAEYGYEFKMVNSKVSEFIANIVTPEGFYPDVLRRTVKTISKTYENESQWEESRINILESIKVVRGNYHAKVGSQLASAHYAENNIIIAPAAVNMLYDYLTQLSTMSFAKLDFDNITTFIKTYTDCFYQRI